MTALPADRPPLREIRALTGARGIAAWWVVLFHVRGALAWLPAPIERAFAKGYLAVDFFFLLSGFVIWLAWHAKLRERGTTAWFLAKRVARIWPLHAAMLALAVALAGLLDATGRPDLAFPWGELPLHVLLLQNWGWTDHLAWNDPAWSISVELAAYCLFPLLVALVDWRRVPSVGLIAIAAAMLAALGWAMAGQPELGADIPRFGLIRCLAEFGTGTVLAALWLRGVPRRATGPALLAVAALAGWWAGVPEILAIPVTWAALLMALARTSDRPGNPLSSRVVHYLGEISYATYLSHFLLWKLFKLAFVRDAAAVSPFAMAAYFGIVLAASVLLYHGLERPAQRWMERRAGRWLSRPARPPVLRSTPR